jgi:hypothetical protein
MLAALRRAPSGFSGPRARFQSTLFDTEEFPEHGSPFGAQHSGR